MEKIGWLLNKIQKHKRTAFHKLRFRVIAKEPGCKITMEAYLLKF
jgi:hypothetical protein